MLYFVKFLYQTFLLPPGVLIMLLLICSLWMRRKNIKISGALLGIAFIFYLDAIPFVGESLINNIESRYTPPSAPSGDVIIMLGGGATLDTPNVGEKGHLMGTAANRLLTCAQLYYKLKIPVVISGGQVFESTGTEAEIAKGILKDIGIPEDKIIAENRSLNTTQNAKYTREIMDEYGFQKPILVTSAFHMDRAVRQFQKVGMNVIPYPTDYQTNIHRRIDFIDFIPSAEALLKVNTALKEYIGVIAAKWY